MIERGTLLRRRQLPQLGQVLVSRGDWVEPQDPVARASPGGGLAIVNVGRELGVGPVEVEGYLSSRPGQAVLQGEPLAIRRTLFGLRQRRVLAPVDGRVLSVYGPWLYLARSPGSVEMVARYRGRVAQVHQGWGVVLEVTGAAVAGVWGSGGEGSGVLRVMAEHPEERLSAERVDERCRGAICIAGSGLGRRALGRLEDVGARGLLLGSLEVDTAALCGGLSFPVVVTEGLGTLGMASPAWEVLQGMDGREASLLGHPRDAWNGRQPELFIADPGVEAAVRPQVPGLRPGSRVRILREPHAGRLAVVEALPSWPQAVESGERLEAAVVSLEGGGRATVALANLSEVGIR